MDQDPYGLLFYAVLVPVMILLAFLVSRVDKWWSKQKRDPVRSAFARLRYATLIAIIGMGVLVLRLQGGVVIGSANPTEGLERHLEKLLQVVMIGMSVCCIWFVTAYSALSVLYAAYVSKEIIPKATKKPI